MNSILKILQFILKTVTTIVDLIGKIPKPLIWAIGLMPGVKKLWASLAGVKTVLFNTVSVAIIFLEKQDWTNLGDWLCQIISFVGQIFNKEFLCDPGWVPAIAASVLAIGNILLRLITVGEVSSSVKPKFGK